MKTLCRGRCAGRPSRAEHGSLGVPTEPENLAQGERTAGSARWRGRGRCNSASAGWGLTPPRVFCLWPSPGELGRDPHGRTAVDATMGGGSVAGLSIASGDDNRRDLRGAVRADQGVGESCESGGECKILLERYLELPPSGNRRRRAPMAWSAEAPTGFAPKLLGWRAFCAGRLLPGEPPGK